MPLEVPFQTQRVESRSVSCIPWLKCKKHRHSVDGIFESPAEEAWEMRASQNPPIAQARVEDSSVTTATGNGMTASSPNLDLIRAFFRRGLRVYKSGGRENGKQYEGSHAFVKSTFTLP